MGDGAVIEEPAAVAQGEKELVAGDAVTAAPMDEVLVSNEAFNAADAKDICTLEVLVRHTRDRVGERVEIRAELLQQSRFCHMHRSGHRPNIQPGLPTRVPVTG